jgi:hypothetical protein
VFVFDCGYFGDPGQSRAEAMRSRLASLEGLIEWRRQNGALHGSPDPERFKRHTMHGYTNTKGRFDRSAKRRPPGSQWLDCISPKVSEKAGRRRAPDWLGGGYVVTRTGTSIASSRLYAQASRDNIQRAKQNGRMKAASWRRILVRGA